MLDPVSALEAALTAPIEKKFALDESSSTVLDHLIASQRSLHTRKAYRQDINDFFKSITGELPTPDSILEFLHLERSQAVATVLKYKAQMIQRGLKEATLNRRLAALKSLTAMGRKLGVCTFTLEEVKGESATKYRDTSGIDSASFKKILALCDRTILTGKRDYALLRLLWDNALRRGEIAQAQVKDFDGENRTLKIRGKGRGSYYEIIDLAPITTEAIQDWLGAREKINQQSPLVCTLDPVYYGKAITGDGICLIVKRLGQKAGIKKNLTPHKIRHSAITAALDATGGDVRRVQKLSRHKQLDTLMIYDDNRQKMQKDISLILADLV